MSDLLMWKDKPVKDCSREELIEAVEWLAREHTRYQDRMATLFEDIRATLRLVPRWPSP